MHCQCICGRLQCIMHAFRQMRGNASLKMHSKCISGAFRGATNAFLVHFMAFRVTLNAFQSNIIRLLRKHPEANASARPCECIARRRPLQFAFPTTGQRLAKRGKNDTSALKWTRNALGMPRNALERHRGAASGSRATKEGKRGWEWHGNALRGVL